MSFAAKVVVVCVAITWVAALGLYHLIKRHPLAGWLTLSGVVVILLGALLFTLWLNGVIGSEKAPRPMPARAPAFVAPPSPEPTAALVEDTRGYDLAEQLAAVVYGAVEPMRWSRVQLRLQPDGHKLWLEDQTGAVTNLRAGSDLEPMASALLARRGSRSTLVTLDREHLGQVRVRDV